MKKAIFLFALMAIALTSLAQINKPAKTDTLKKATVVPAKPEAVKPPAYQLDLNKPFVITLSISQWQSLKQTSEKGVLPFLKTTKVPGDNIDDYDKSLFVLRYEIDKQFSLQATEDWRKFKADSLAKYAPPVGKKVKLKK